MITKEINIPDSINDIELWRWQKYMSIVDKNTDEDFANRKALEIYYDISGKYYNNLKVKDIEKIIFELNNALTQKPTLVRRFTMNNIEYGFIPNLDDITFGEFVDLDKYTDIKDYHRLMSILFRPIINSDNDRYIVEKYTGSNEDMLDMPLGIALSAVAFFLTIAIQLTKSTLKSLNLTEKVQMRKRDLAVSGLGILQSTHYPMETFINLMKQKI